MAHFQIQVKQQNLIGNVIPCTYKATATVRLVGVDVGSTFTPSFVFNMLKVTRPKVDPIVNSFETLTRAYKLIRGQAISTTACSVGCSTSYCLDLSLIVSMKQCDRCERLQRFRCDPT